MSLASNSDGPGTCASHRPQIVTNLQTERDVKLDAFGVERVIAPIIQAVGAFADKGRDVLIVYERSMRSPPCAYQSERDARGIHRFNGRRKRNASG